MSKEVFILVCHLNSKKSKKLTTDSPPCLQLNTDDICHGLLSSTRHVNSHSLPPSYDPNLHGTEATVT
jgi:hypothetical protein